MQKAPTLLALFLLTLVSACTEQIDTVYQFQDGFVLVEGQVADLPGESRVSVSQSELVNDLYRLNRLEGTRVFSIDGAGTTLEWVGTTGSIEYTAPEGFVAEPDRTYFIRVELPDGRVLESTPEGMPQPVAIGNLGWRFEQEAYFDPRRDRFVPAIHLLLDADDPPDTRNYYRWESRSFRQLFVCASCERQRFRNGQCEDHRSARFVERWDYFCDGPCWQSTRSLRFELFDDALSQGLPVRGLEVGRRDFNWFSGGTLFEVQQQQLTLDHYNYARLLRQLAFESGGLSAVTPAALIGNMRNVNREDDQILGYFGAVSIDTARVFIDRNDIDGTPIAAIPMIRPEPEPPGCMVDCPPPAPCVGPGRTRIRPEGWPE